jgi:D-alanine-D-alanine ligase
MLEASGVSVAGGTADACDLADDKARAREACASIGVPIPRGCMLTRPDETVDLPWPRVLKAPHEHMSRGLAVVRTPDEQHARARELIAKFGLPLVVEEFVAGRELGVTLVERESGLEALPVAEWPLSRDVLTEAEKLDAVTFPFVAKLDDATRARVVDAALGAFRALGLRDYARVDLRLDAAGRPFVLETNPRPSLEPDGPTAISAAALGLSITDVVRWALERAEARAHRPRR